MQTFTIHSTKLIFIFPFFDVRLVPPPAAAPIPPAKKQTVRIPSAQFHYPIPLHSGNQRHPLLRAFIIITMPSCTTCTTATTTGHEMHENRVSCCHVASSIKHQSREDCPISIIYPRRSLVAFYDLTTSNVRCIPVENAKMVHGRDPPRSSPTYFHYYCKCIYILFLKTL